MLRGALPRRNLGQFARDGFPRDHWERIRRGRCEPLPFSYTGILLGRENKPDGTRPAPSTAPRPPLLISCCSTCPGFQFVRICHRPCPALACFLLQMQPGNLCENCVPRAGLADRLLAGSADSSKSPLCRPLFVPASLSVLSQRVSCREAGGSRCRGRARQRDDDQGLSAHRGG